MVKRNERSLEEPERRAKIRELLQLSGVSSMEDIQSLFKETVTEFMENGLEVELTEELGYSKYDYKSKETQNSRNGHSSKKLRTSYGKVNVSIPRDRKGKFEPPYLYFRSIHTTLCDYTVFGTLSATYLAACQNSFNSTTL